MPHVPMRLLVGQHQMHLLWLHYQRQRHFGFRDDHFNDLFSGRDKLPEFLVECDREACLDLFDEYLKIPHKSY